MGRKMLEEVLSEEQIKEVIEFYLKPNSLRKTMDFRHPRSKEQLDE